MGEEYCEPAPLFFAFSFAAALPLGAFDLFFLPIVAYSICLFCVTQFALQQADHRLQRLHKRVCWRRDQVDTRQ